jgi:hypothetical protein
MAPGGFITALLGSSLENIKSVQFFGALAAFIALMFVPLVYSRITGKSKREIEESVSDGSDAPSGD